MSDHPFDEAAKVMRQAIADIQGRSPLQKPASPTSPPAGTIVGADLADIALAIESARSRIELLIYKFEMHPEELRAFNAQSTAIRKACRRLHEIAKLAVR